MSAATSRRKVLAVLVALGSSLPVLASGKQKALPSQAASAWRGPGELTQRESRRAFYSAPPVVPHDVARYDRDNQSCLRCHLKAKPLGAKTSMRVPHPELSNCMQCHVAAISPLRVLHHDATASPGPPPANAFGGLAEPTERSRAHFQAPPPVPHRMFMRENCAGCHNPKAPNPAMRMDHPERTSCLQCHVPTEAAEFRLSSPHR